MLLAEDRYAEYLTIIRRRSVFEIAGFDDPESVELVEYWRKHGDYRRKMKPGTPETWAKLKYDRQIAAIAVTRRVERIYSTDLDLKIFAQHLNIKYVGLPDLPLPPTSQEEFNFEEQDTSALDVSSKDVLTTPESGAVTTVAEIEAGQSEPETKEIEKQQ